MEKFRKRLATWESISKKGRPTLIGCKLASVPAYLMSLFRIQTDVNKRLEKILERLPLGRSKSGKENPHYQLGSSDPKQKQRRPRSQKTS